MKDEGARWRERLREQTPVLAAAGVSLAAFALFSGPMLLHRSHAPHFVYQAAGWLQGTLSIPGEPPDHNDWVLRDRRWFVSFPPFPAALMLPFVALHGLAFNDVFFTACLAALAVALLVLLMRRWRDAGEHDRSDRQILLLAGMFAFGTVFFPAAIRGEVWFTAHVVGVLLTVLYLMAARGARHPALAGLAFGCATITRTSLGFAFPFVVLECLAPEGRVPPLREWPGRLRRAIPPLVAFGIPAALVLGAALWVNHARFGDWGEFGHRLLWDNRVNDRVREHGLFSLRYLPDNFRSAFLLLPSVSLSPPRLGFDGNGMSMFATTPLLALLAVPARRARPTLALGVTMLCVAVPLLLYMNNGWYQFGFRFSIDFLPYAFLLLLVGERPFDRWFLALGAAGVAVCTWGALVFNR